MLFFARNKLVETVNCVNLGTLDYVECNSSRCVRLLDMPDYETRL